METRPDMRTETEAVLHELSLDQQDRSTATLSCAWVDTPVGPLLAVADDEQLLMLEFAGKRRVETDLRRLGRTSTLTAADNSVISNVRAELAAYFSGELREFRTPFLLSGTDFQKDVWRELSRIPYGETISYLELAKRVGRPTAFRAVAQANGANRLPVIIPCHRVINADGRIGGYGGGVQRKELLLELEQRQLQA